MNSIKWYKRKKRNKNDHEYNDTRQVERINERQYMIRKTKSEDKQKYRKNQMRRRKKENLENEKKTEEV